MKLRKISAAIGAIITLAANPAFALYDAAADVALSTVQGAWEGSLTYRDLAGLILLVRAASAKSHGTQCA
jgi:hypothetical protein